MLERIYVVTDLGPGDGGKGGIVHALSCRLGATIVIKRGGAQGSHGVCTARGEKFNFSQWGCGTFEGVPTFLSEQMIISPVGLTNEAEALERHGIYDPFVLLSADPACICATPFHRVSSQLEELLRKDNPRGTIGTGVGQAYRMYKALGDVATIRAMELVERKTVHHKLQQQIAYYRERYAKISPSDGLAEDEELISKNLKLLYDDDYLLYTLNLFEDVGKKLNLTGLDEIINKTGSAIVECSHGVLTDAETGLKPHVSAIRTLPEFTAKMLKDAGYDGLIINYAVHRAYEIRHGAGPMPTYDKSFTEQMLPGSHKNTNRWQGAVRAGPLDLNLLRYAFEASDKEKFDGLCLTWFDQVLACGRKWSICVGYSNSPMANESYVEFLEKAKPIITEHLIKKPIHRQELFELVNNVLGKTVGIPLTMLSVGPTELDKISSQS